MSPGAGSGLLLWRAAQPPAVDNTDPAKLIIPAIEALKDCGYVVVATTAGAQTDALRARFSQPNVVIADFINYDDLFPHVDVFVTSGGFGSNLAAFLHGVPVVGAGKREGKNDINARIGYNKLGIDLRSEHPKRAARCLGRPQRLSHWGRQRRPEAGQRH